MKICCLLLVLLPACHAGDEEAMLQMTAANSLEAISSTCPSIPPDFQSQCSTWLETCLASKMRLRIRKRWRNKWPKPLDHWLRHERGGNGVGAVEQFMKACGQKFCCGRNHRFGNDRKCRQKMTNEAKWPTARLHRVHGETIKHNTYPLAMVSRIFCSRIKPNIISAVQLDTVTEGKGDVKVGGKGSNVSLVSLSTDPDCIEPVNMQPDLWDCKCHMNMKKKCEDLLGPDFDANVEKDCFHAQMCNHGKVCGSWKGNYCPSSGRVKELQDRLLQHSGLLQKQEQSDDTKALMGLDGTVQGKSCK